MYWGFHFVVGVLATFFIFAAGAPSGEDVTEIGVEDIVQRPFDTTSLSPTTTNTLTTSTMTLDVTRQQEQQQHESFDITTYILHLFGRKRHTITPDQEFARLHRRTHSLSARRRHP